MDKEDIIKNISNITIETKKKMLATRSFYFQIKDTHVNDFDEDDKITTILLLHCSFYEKFIKNIYNELINFLNFLKKYNKNYPEEFNYLSFLYSTVSDNPKKSKLRYFKLKQEQKFIESLNFPKFLSENQKLSNIKSLIEFNLFILNKSIKNIELHKYLTEEKEKITNEEIFEKLSTLYTLRNDRIHGSYSQEIRTFNDEFFDFFTLAVNILSETLISVLEEKF